MGNKGVNVAELKPIMMMIMVQFGTAGQNILYELAANDGMDVRVLVAYRLLFATAFMVPLALCVERNRRPKMTWMVLGQAFLGGLFGASLCQNLYAKSLVMTSPTFASAMINIIPAITFILAVSFRLESLGLSTMAGKAKIVGTLMSIGGAMLLTVYKGVELHLWSTGVNLLNHGGHVASAEGGVSRDFVLGCVLLIISCISLAVALIIQTKMSKAYPCHYSSTALMAMMGTIQAFVFALCSQRDWEQWKLGWNIRLLTVSYSGIVVSGIMIIFTMCCVHMKGPLYVSIFNPLVLIIVAIVGSLTLDEKLHLGSVIGAVIIICGLYVVLWGKSKEIKKIVPLIIPSKSHSESQHIEIVVPSSTADQNYKQSNSCKIAPVINLPTTDDEGGVSSSK